MCRHKLLCVTCAWVIMICTYVYTCVCVCMWRYPRAYARVACVYGYMCEYTLCVCVDSPTSLCVWLHVTSDSFVRSELVNGRFEFVSILNPIHRRFEDQLIRWSRDSYRFMQWRPNGDSVLKSCHFMWVILCECLFLYISLFTVVGMHLHVTLIISCDFMLYFTSLIFVSLHETSIIVHLIYVVDMSLHKRHFMCW